MSVFSRSNAATWRSGDSTLRRRRSARSLRLLPGLVLAREWWTIDGRWMVLTYVGQSTLRGSMLNAA